MTSFDQRMKIALSHEDAVKRELERADWRVDKTGKGFLPDHVKAVITGPLRWFPDLTAVKGLKWCFVDPKSEVRTDTPNYSIENAALELYKNFENNFRARLFVVFPGMNVLTVADIVANCGSVQDGRGSNGSGTPYVLISKRFARPFDQVFGCKRSAEIIRAESWRDQYHGLCAFANAFAGTPMGELARWQAEALRARRDIS